MLSLPVLLTAGITLAFFAFYCTAIIVALFRPTLFRHMERLHPLYPGRCSDRHAKPNSQH